MIHRSHIYCNFLLVISKGWWTSAPQCLEAKKSLSHLNDRHIAESSFFTLIQRKFWSIIFPSRLPAQTLQSACDNWMYPGLSSSATHFQGIGSYLAKIACYWITWGMLQVIYLESSSCTKGRRDPTLPKDVSCRATSCIKNTRKPNKGFSHLRHHGWFVQVMVWTDCGAK